MRKSISNPKTNKARSIPKVVSIIEVSSILKFLAAAGITAMKVIVFIGMKRTVFYK